MEGIGRDRVADAEGLWFGKGFWFGKGLCFGKDQREKGEVGGGFGRELGSEVGEGELGADVVEVESSHGLGFGEGRDLTIGARSDGERVIQAGVRDGQDGGVEGEGCGAGRGAREGDGIRVGVVAEPVGRVGRGRVGGAVIGDRVRHEFGFAAGNELGRVIGCGLGVGPGGQAGVGTGRRGGCAGGF
ncbi:hypothetical protein O159_27620 [Leifsonia xyli subsp. cynodontis DSM 46306]|uniref:Uncharacterized protein n=1 Tax=Leifsonia xyli subsp. cynodontis DSM 46306 TaxID=1389489 RepID=U3P8P1_LEIXC|nr:hypothetical protein O159_27620 [Leifsonia xyli subsp. cynodontis DSM 46306]